MLDPGSLERLKRTAEDLFRARGVLAAYAFGSRLSGRPRPDSDLDIGYYLEPHRPVAPIPLAEEMDLAAKLSSAAGFTVDLRDLSTAPLELRGRVLEEGVRIYSGHPADRVSLERTLLSRYHDYKTIFEEMHARRLQVIAERGPLMVDQAKLDQMLANLGRYVGVLRALGAESAEAFLANSDKVGNAKYHFVIAIECSIDIANHVIASENYRFPRDNADSFVVLGEQGVLDPAFATTLGTMARFRNRLVHIYWDVNDRQVRDYLETSLSDFDRFAREVAARWS